LIKIKATSADFAFSFSEVAVSKNVYILTKVTDDHPGTSDKIYSVEETNITVDTNVQS
jgi:hypothetical protein